MAIGDKYKPVLPHLSKMIYEVLYENEEGKLLKSLSFTAYYTNEEMCNFSLIKEPRKTEKRYAIVYECKDGSLLLGNDLYFQRHDAEWAGKNKICYKFHSILEVQYTEEL